MAPQQRRRKSDTVHPVKILFETLLKYWVLIACVGSAVIALSSDYHSNAQTLKQIAADVKRNEANAKKTKNEQDAAIRAVLDELEKREQSSNVIRSQLDSLQGKMDLLIMRYGGR